MKQILKDIRKEYNKKHNRYNNKELFKLIKHQAVYNQQGFGTHRKEIYTYLLKLKEEINTLSNTALRLTSSCEFRSIKTQILPRQLINQNENGKEDKYVNNKNIDILKKDLPRCIYHHIKDFGIINTIDFDDFEQCITHLLISKDLNYSFYQGYLDVCVYMFTIFSKESDSYSKSISSVNRITEILLKDYITIPEKGSDIFNQAVNFLSEIISLSDQELGDKMQKDSCCLCLVLSWVLTLMTHDLNDPSCLYRLLDYLIISEPYAIYVFTSLIVYDVLKKAIDSQTQERKLSIDSQSSTNGIEKYYVYLSNIKLDKLNFYDYICKTDEFIKLRCDEINEIRKKYKNSLKSIGNVEYHGIRDFLIPRENNVLKQKMLLIALTIVVLLLSFAIIYYIQPKQLLTVSN